MREEWRGKHKEGRTRKERIEGEEESKRARK